MCSARGDDGNRADLGRDVLGVGVGPGEGDAEFLVKGLLRQRGPFCAGAAMARREMEVEQLRITMLRQV